VDRLGAQIFEFAKILQADIAQERARQQAGFRENLKTVADSKNHAAFFRKIGNRVHHRRELRERAGSQVVTICKSAGQDDRVESLYGRVLVPNVRHRLSEHRLDRVIAIVLAIRSWKNNDTEFHAHSQIIRYSSITGFVKTSFARRSTCSRLPSFNCTLKILPCRTSVTSVRPSDARLRWIVIPCGSRTVGFNVTMTVAFIV